VNSALTKTTSQVRAALRYFAPCIRRVRPCTQSGNRSGTRSWTIVERRPPLWGGYIQSEKCRTSTGPRKRSTGGHPARLQPCRQKCANGRNRSRGSTGRPASDSRIVRRPGADVGANGTMSAPASTSPASEPRT
jgi:hypothetical protein